MKKDNLAIFYRAFAAGRKINELFWYTNLACLGCDNAAEDRVDKLLDELSVMAQPLVTQAEKDALKQQFVDTKPVLPELLRSSELADARLAAAEKVRQALLSKDDPRYASMIRQRACQDVLADVLMQIGRLMPGLMWYLEAAVPSGIREALTLGRAVDEAIRPLGQYGYLYDPEPLSRLKQKAVPEAQPRAGSSKRSGSGRKRRAGTAPKASSTSGEPSGEPTSREMLEDPVYWPWLYLANRSPEPGSMPLPSTWIDHIEHLWVELWQSLGVDRPPKPLAKAQWASLPSLDVVAKVDKVARRGLVSLPSRQPRVDPLVDLDAGDAVIGKILRSKVPVYIQFRQAVDLFDVRPGTLHEAVNEKKIIPCIRGNRPVQGGHLPVYVSVEHTRQFVRELRGQATRSSGESSDVLVNWSNPLGT